MKQKTTKPEIQSHEHQKLAIGLSRITAFAERASEIASTSGHRVVAKRAIKLEQAAQALRDSLLVIAQADDWRVAGFYKPNRETDFSVNAQSHMALGPEGGVAKESLVR